MTQGFYHFNIILFTKANNILANIYPEKIINIKYNHILEFGSFSFRIPVSTDSATGHVIRVHSG